MWNWNSVEARKAGTSQSQQNLYWQSLHHLRTMQLQDHNHLWKDMWPRIMCLKLKHSGHWNLSQVTIHLTPPRTLLNCFQQCSLMVKLLASFLVESEHFKKLLQDSNVSGPFVVLFDESLSTKMQQKQMDAHVKFFNDQTNQVTTRYFNSEFLGECWVLLWTSYNIASSLTFCADVDVLMKELITNFIVYCECRPWYYWQLDISQKVC